MKKGKRFSRVDWEKWQHLLGTMTDQELANKIGCDRTAVGFKRNSLGIPLYSSKPENKAVKCECGCGESMMLYDNRGRERTYIKGHISRLQEKTGQWVSCEQCGKELYRQNWHMANSQHHFCGHECEGKWSSQNGRRRGKNNGRYNTITVKCAGGCGNTVSKAKSLIVRRNKKVYCPDCLYLTKKGRRGFYVGYPKSFSPALRKQIRRRDNYTCQECGCVQKKIGYTLHVHHIDYDKKNNSPMNLISLCRKCHGITNFGTKQWRKKYAAVMLRRFPNGIPE